MKAKTKTLMNNHGQPPFQIHETIAGPSACTHGWIGLSHPPRNSVAARKEIKIMFAYSVRKNTANGAPEYSTWNPATISDSPSATSNGARFVFATPEAKR